MDEETNEAVEVVYSMDYLWQVAAILLLGLWVGFVCGMGGVSFG